MNKPQVHHSTPMPLTMNRNTDIIQVCKFTYVHTCCSTNYSLTLHLKVFPVYLIVIGSRVNMILVVAVKV